MSNKPQITATIKFRGVTIEGMTVEELRQLRDVLNTLVGEPKVVERIVERHDHIYPYRVYPSHPWYTTSGSWTVASDSISAGNTSNGSNSLSATYADTPQTLTISCN